MAVTLGVLLASGAFDEWSVDLVGPFDVLAGRFDGATGLTAEDFLRHWRYFYDPPEFQTVARMVGSAGKDGLHFGYLR